MTNIGNTWYPQGNGYTQEQNTNKGVFATFVDGEDTVKNYLVPAGGMAILIDLNGGKMWFKSVNINGVPAPVRTFNIKEIPLPVPEGANIVTRAEFNALSQQINQLTQILQSAKDGTDKDGGKAK